jgi:hypothetical protein
MSCSSVQVGGKAVREPVAEFGRDGGMPASWPRCSVSYWLTAVSSTVLVS